MNVRVEESIQGLDGIKRVTSTAAEGRGTVVVELELGADARKVLDDIKSRIDAIDTFPEQTEKPIIQELTNRRQVINLAVWGDADETTLKRLAERIRDEIASTPGISQVELANAPPYEISIEVSENTLRRHGLSFDFVARAVRRSSLDMPGGSVKTQGGEILLRTKGQAYRGREFEDLVLLTRPDGTHLRLGDVATVVDGFADTDQFSRFDGKPAILLQVFRTGDQGALEVGDKVKAYAEQAQSWLPEGVQLSTWRDQTKVLRDRLDLLTRNGRNGFLLVVAVLALFLRFRLAAWVSLGIPISFLGAVWLMPTLDVSVNLFSLFAFILVLGIVVDDAIIVGENIYTHHQRHGEPLKAAIEGAQEVSVPVVFAVLTTVAAFMPMLAVPGNIGKIMRVMPMIVIPALLFSLVESLWILPAHLSHLRSRDTSEVANGSSRRWGWYRVQSRVVAGLHYVIEHQYKPSLELALRWRYVTLAVALSILIFTVGLVGAGWVRFIFFPQVEADFVIAALTMPQGTPEEVTAEAVAHLERTAEEVREEMQVASEPNLYRHAISTIGDQPQSSQLGGPITGGDVNLSGSHLGEVFVELAPAEDRTVGSEELANRWRQRAGAIPDAVQLRVSSSLFSPGDDVDVQLTGSDVAELRAAAAELKQRLAEYPGVYDIGDSFREGKREVKLQIKPAAELLGLTLGDLGGQVRQAFYGEEAQRIQRGRDDIRVMVRYPQEERRSLADMENMRIRTPDGSEVPFSQVAEVEPGRGYASITRVDRRRAVNVTASVDASLATPGDIVADLDARVMPEIRAEHPGVLYTFEGQQAEQRDTLGGLAAGLHPRPSHDLRPPGHPPALLPPAARHHVRHPVRSRGGGLGPRDHGHRSHDPLDVRSGGPFRRRGQRQPGDGRLHQPSPRNPPAGRGRSSGRCGPLPAHSPDLPDDVLRAAPAPPRAEPAGQVPRPHGRLPRLRRGLRHVHLAGAGALRLHHLGGPEGRGPASAGRVTGTGRAVPRALRPEARLRPAPRPVIRSGSGDGVFLLAGSECVHSSSGFVDLEKR